MTDPTAELLQAMAGDGLHPKQINWDSSFHRFPGVGQKKGDNGYVKAFVDQRGAIYGDNRTKLRRKWTMTGLKPLTDEERAENKRREQDATKQRKKDAIAAQKRVDALWDRGKPCENHPYLERRGIKDVPMKAVSGPLVSVPDKDTGEPILLVPMYNADQRLENIQRIWPDGTRKQMKGVRKTGLFNTIGGLVFRETNRIYVCEGWATGLTIHLATEGTVAVAFFDGGLKTVATILRKKYPDAHIIIAADNDRWSKVWRGDKQVWNPGVVAAQEAAKAAKAELCIPDFKDLSDIPEGEKGPTDYDDLRQREGLDAVRKRLEPKMVKHAVTEVIENDLEPDDNPLGENDRPSDGSKSDPPDQTGDQPEPQEPAMDMADLMEYSGDRSGQEVQAYKALVAQAFHERIQPGYDGTYYWGTDNRWHGPGEKNRVPSEAVSEAWNKGCGVRRSVTSGAFTTLSDKVAMLRDKQAFDENPYLAGLPTPARETPLVADLEAGEVRAMRKTDYVTRRLGAVPKDLPTPFYRDSLEWWSDGDPQRQEVLENLLASALIGSPTLKSFWFLLGPKHSGKTSFANLGEAIAGDYACAIQSDSLDTRGRKESEMVFGGIKGMRWAYVAELPPGRRLRHDLLNAICGGDTVQASAKYLNQWNMKIGATLAMSANSLPGVDQLSDALHSRVRIILFQRPMPTDKLLAVETVRRHIADELPGIMHRLLGVAKQLIARQMAIPTSMLPKADADAVEAWLISADELKGFANLLTPAPGAFISNDELLPSAKAHFRDHGFPWPKTKGGNDWSATQLSAALNRAGCGRPDRVSTDRGRADIVWK